MKQDLYFIIYIIIDVLQLYTYYIVYFEYNHKQYNDGYFTDVLDNLNQAPIKKIEIINKKNDSCENLFSLNTPIYHWKEKYFKFERIKSNLYKLKKKEKQSIEIGTDSLSNKLYSKEKVINFIEITNSSEPSISKLNYSVITRELDSKTFLHYSYDYIEGRVLVDIKIGFEKKPCDNKKLNEFLLISDYLCNDSDLDLGNTYQKLDETIIKDYNDNKTLNFSQKINLYSRTYIGVPDEYIKYHNLEKIKSFENRKSTILYILYEILIFIYFYIFFLIQRQNTDSEQQKIIFLDFKIKAIFSLIIIPLLSNAINNYNKYNKFLFSKLNHGINSYYKKNIWFIQLDIYILIIQIISILPSVVPIFRIVAFFVIFGMKELVLIFEKLTKGIEKKQKRKEKKQRKQRIKKLKEEIKEFENNPDIPISKINEKRLQFFKEKFYDALTCPISLDIFKDPVIVSSGHTYEREYILKIINDKCLDPITREPLNKTLIIDNYLVNNIKKEFNSGINFNETVFNKITELLKCPLSHKFFNEPYIALVIGNKGMTYEKIFIELYITQNNIDPTFNMPIQGGLIKNYVIKDMIDSLIEMNQKKKDYSIVLINDIDEKNNTDDKLNRKNEKINNSYEINNNIIDSNKI